MLIAIALNNRLLYHIKEMKMTNIFVKIGANLYSQNEWEFPSDRVFREAWTSNGNESGVIEVDMKKARNIWRDKIREARKEVFLSLDAEFIRALEEGAPTEEIVAKKKILRDAPADPRIDEAETPEDLKQIIPLGIKKLQ